MDRVEDMDMSLEDLQQLLLLRSHQQNTVEAGSSAGMDVSVTDLDTCEV